MLWSVMHKALFCREENILKPSVKYSIYLIVAVSFFIVIVPGHADTKDNRWVYISQDKDDASTSYYYDSETITPHSYNQVGVWLKAATSTDETLYNLEISCVSGMFHIIEGSFDIWGRRSKTSYIAGRWIITPPNSEVYLLSKMICKDIRPRK